MSSRRRQPSAQRARAIALAFLLLSGCEMLEPEVAVVNNIGPQVLVRNPSFNGVVWNTTLRYGESTSPRRCLEGDGRVHFQRIDAHAYCRRQAEYGLVDSICMCDSSWLSSDTDIIRETPIFYNYQTVSTTDAGCGGYYLIELTPADTEQDFSVPGPYGH